MPISLSPRGKERDFENNEFGIFEGDVIYLFSDIFYDQFRGKITGNLEKTVQRTSAFYTR